MHHKILVTGGAGYIGSIMVPELLAQGHKVTVIDSFMFKQNSLAAVCAHPNFEIVNADVRDAKVVGEAMKKHDILIPLAALVGAPLCSKDPMTATAVNHDVPLRTFKEMSRDQWVLMPTTNSAYGSGQKDSYCDETSTITPISLYAKDKVEVEKALMERGNAVSFRLATVFGMSPRMRTDLLVNDFTYRAVHDRFVVLFEPHFKRNYVHVRDVTRAFQFGIENFEKIKGEVFNVGLSDANISKMELCQVIKKQLPDFTFPEAEVGKDPDQRNYVVSNAKIEKAGFKTQYSLDAGIGELIKGFKMIKNSNFGNV
jgi:nucleoside-diphosphate-sugar epimerase